MAFINFKNIVEKNIPKHYIQPRRSQIYVGFQCNQKCSFCYYKKRNNEQMFSKEYVLKQIDLLLQYGIKDIEITGGEPSECKNLRFYCQYIKEKSPTSKIAVITNGGLYNSDIWDLIDEVLVSHHASINFNNINIFPHGNNYAKVKKTINKAKQTNKFIRTNTIIAKFNVDYIDKIVDDLIYEFEPNIINFLPINLFDDAEDMHNQIDYNIIRPILKKQIDKIKIHLPNSNIFIRYMPFCDMEGYEKYIVGTLQNTYDWFDWNHELCGMLLLNYIDNYNINDILQILGQYGKTSFDAAYAEIKKLYTKTAKCLTCKYNIICDGIENTVKNIDQQLKPTTGKTIKNILEYIENTTEKIYKNVYK